MANIYKQSYKHTFTTTATRTMGEKGTTTGRRNGAVTAAASGDGGGGGGGKKKKNTLCYLVRLSK